jgi:hypothetical protein
MLKKKNVDYGIELNQQILDYLKSKRFNPLQVEESQSIQTKRL